MTILYNVLSGYGENFTTPAVGCKSEIFSLSVLCENFTTVFSLSAPMGHLFATL